MDDKTEFKDLTSERTISTIVIGSASYFSHERVYEKDVQATFDAYKDALEQAMKWIYEFKGEQKYSAKVYMTEYLKPAKASHFPHKAGITEFIFKQRVRVFLREVTSIEECTPEMYAEWEKKEAESGLATNEAEIAGSGSCGHIPWTVYKIIKADGANWEDTFENVLKRLNALKNFNTMYDAAAESLVSLSNSCDEFVMLRGNENHIEAGVRMTIPFVYEFEKPHLVDVHEAPELRQF
jgi:hypothetical protein